MRLIQKNRSLCFHFITGCSYSSSIILNYIFSKFTSDNGTIYMGVSHSLGAEFTCKIQEHKHIWHEYNRIIRNDSKVIRKNNLSNDWFLFNSNRFLVISR